MNKVKELVIQAMESKVLNVLKPLPPWFRSVSQTDQGVVCVTDKLAITLDLKNSGLEKLRLEEIRNTIISNCELARKKHKVI